MSESDRFGSDLFNQIATDFFDIEEIHREVELQRRRARPRAEGPFAPPRTLLERSLAALWTEVLGIERAGIEDDFFDSGGSSILGTQLLSRVYERFGIDLPLRVLFDSPPTIAALAEAVELQRNSQLLGVVPEAGGDDDGTTPYRDAGRPRPTRDATPGRTGTRAAFPLSYAQQRLWFLHNLDPDNRAYNSLFGLRIRGRLDPWALEQSLGEITRRHETLRTAFQILDGEPVQVILPHTRLALPEIDLTRLPEPSLQAVITTLMEGTFSRPYNFEQGGLLRLHLVRAAEQEHLLLIAAHHIVFDGWSFSVFAREMTGIYRGFRIAKPAPLRDLKVQYADLSVVQRNRKDPSLFEGQLGYWRRQLEGLTTLQLPADRPAPSIRSDRGARESLWLPASLTSSLRDLSRREGATLFMALLTGFCALLHRYSGQDDIAVGSPIANRNRIEDEELIGCFINTLVFRIDLSALPTGRQAINRGREVALGAFDNQGLPFEKLVNELAPERDLGVALFQVMFILQNTPESAFALPGLEVDGVPFYGGSVKFNIVLSVFESDRNLLATVEYATDLYERARICRMLAHLQVLLDGMSSLPDRKLSELPLLTLAERQQLLVDWADTNAGYPLDLCMHQMIAEQVERTPDSIALSFDDELLTYRDMNDRANQLARYLVRRGVGVETLVGICLDRSIEMLLAVNGVLKAGAAYVPLDPDYPADRINSILRDAEVSAVLTVERLRPVVSGATDEVITLDLDWEAIAAEGTEDLRIETYPQNLAYVIYTSGSTGRPKGVMISHRAMNNLVLWMQEMFKIDNSDKLLQKTPFSFDPSVWEFFWPLVTGGVLVIARPGGHLESSYMVDCIIERGVTVLQLVPSMLQLLVEEPRFHKCESLRLVYCGAETLSPTLINTFYARLNSRLSNVYGPTEAAMHVTLWPCQPRSDGLVSIGRPAGNIRTYLLSGQIESMPVGVPGELHIGGTQLARGYLNAPDLTADKFVPGSFSSDSGARLYRTGDLARYLDDGNIEFLGRLDHQVKIRGFRIEPAEIEDALNRHTAVHQSLVIVNDDQTARKRLVAYIVAAPGPAPLKEDLRLYLKESLPPYMVPSAFVIIDRIPLMPNGKVDRRALPSPEGPGGDERDQYVAPRNRAEQLLADIWSRTLGLERVGINDNFFELGGDSILSILIIAKANQAGLHLTPKLLFEHQTVAELAAGAGLAQRIEAEQGMVTGQVPLTPIQISYFER
ncbi:MAG TPA: amino acid adenylation domain-containing protein, partial [Blastocatellia bacterium]|nr:amino acid adenylation domain-containing protein [Blastocatellia bacterium]